jgi:hypothetical protein
VIAKVTRGDQPREAVGYPFSPGSHNEHEDAYAVAVGAALEVADGLSPTEGELNNLAASFRLESRRLLHLARSEA